MKKTWTESAAWDAVKSAGDLLALNVLCFLFCIPVITIVASFSAMYSVLFKLKRDRSIPVIRTFFSSLKENILPSIAVELIVLVLGVIVYGDAYYALSQEGGQRTLFLTVATIVGVVALILLTYGTSQIANFRNSVKNYIKNSFVLALVAPGWMVLVWLVWAVVFGVLLAYPSFVLQYLGWAYFMWGLSFPAFVSSVIFAKVFKRFEPEAVESPDESRIESEEGLSEEIPEDRTYPGSSILPDDDSEDLSDEEAEDQSNDESNADPDDSEIPE